MTSKPAKQWQLLAVWAGLLFMFVINMLLFWAPTNDAVKRIESMKPCAMSGESK